MLERIVHVPMIHFGDLDSSGVRIFVHLREQRPDLLWFIPSLWAQFVESHGRGCCGSLCLTSARFPLLCVNSPSAAL